MADVTFLVDKFGFLGVLCRVSGFGRIYEVVVVCGFCSFGVRCVGERIFWGSFRGRFFGWVLFFTGE